MKQLIKNSNNKSQRRILRIIFVVKLRSKHNSAFKGSSDKMIKLRMSPFPYLHNDKTKNLLLPNIGRNKGDDDRQRICHGQC
jgi:hypothetical protein